MAVVVVVVMLACVGVWVCGCVGGERAGGVGGRVCVYGGGGGGGGGVCVCGGMGGVHGTYSAYFTVIMCARSNATTHIRGGDPSTVANKSR